MCAGGDECLCLTTRESELCSRTLRHVFIDSVLITCSHSEAHTGYILHGRRHGRRKLKACVPLRASSSRRHRCLQRIVRLRPTRRTLLQALGYVILAQRAQPRPLHPLADACGVEDMLAAVKLYDLLACGVGAQTHGAPARSAAVRGLTCTWEGTQVGREDAEHATPIRAVRTSLPRLPARWDPRRRAVPGYRTVRVPPPWTADTVDSAVTRCPPTTIAAATGAASRSARSASPSPSAFPRARPAVRCCRLPGAAQPSAWPRERAVRQIAARHACAGRWSSA